MEMNAEQKMVYDYAQVMLAFAHGEKIEFNSRAASGGWCNLEAKMPSWSWGVYDYRVAPKMPLEVKATVIGDNVIAWVQNSSMDASGKQRVVLFREVV